MSSDDSSSSDSFEGYTERGNNNDKEEHGDEGNNESNSAEDNNCDSENSSLSFRNKCSSSRKSKKKVNKDDTDDESDDEYNESASENSDEDWEETKYVVEGGRRRSLIICRECNERMPNHGRGLCRSCYKEWAKSDERPKRECVNCGKLSHIQARAMCTPCYRVKISNPRKLLHQQLLGKKPRPDGPKIANNTIEVCKICQETDKTGARGICNDCAAAGRDIEIKFKKPKPEIHLTATANPISETSNALLNTWVENVLHAHPQSSESTKENVVKVEPPNTDETPSLNNGNNTDGPVSKRSKNRDVSDKIKQEYPTPNRLDSSSTEHIPQFSNGRSISLPDHTTSKNKKSFQTSQGTEENNPIEQRPSSSKDKHSTTPSGNKQNSMSTTKITLPIHQHLRSSEDKSSSSSKVVISPQNQQRPHKDKSNSSSKVVTAAPPNQQCPHSSKDHSTTPSKDKQNPTPIPKATAPPNQQRSHSSKDHSTTPSRDKNKHFKQSPTNCHSTSPSSTRSANLPKKRKHSDVPIIPVTLSKVQNTGKTVDDPIILSSDDD